MTSLLHPGHLGRYHDIARLLLKHGRGTWRAVEGRGDPETAAADARRLVRELEEMGPTFVKLGQLLSTRPDLLPASYIDELARLQDEVEAFPYAEVEPLVEGELGVRMHDAFNSFEAEPIAAASLGQVHAAELRSGRQVAVKVQRPDVRARVQGDMDAIEEVAAFVDEHTRAGRRYGFSGMVEQFRRAINAELDYEIEAANLRSIHDALDAYDRLVIPLPVDDYTTSRVLTMDYVPGRNTSSIGPLARLEVDGDELAEQLLRAYLDQVLVHRTFHADPHPGNVMLTDDGRLALVDLGMVATVPADLQDDLARLLVAATDRHGDVVAEVFADMGEQLGDYDEAAFRSRIRELVEQHREATAGNLSAGRLLGELVQVAGASGLRPPVELTMLGRTLLALDDVAQRIAPDFDPDPVVRDHLTSVLRRRLTDSTRPTSVVSAALDAKEFAEKLPGRVNSVMDALAAGELTLNVQGIDEQELMRGVQKLANRVTTGVIAAALLMAGGLIAGVDSSFDVFGYPVLSIVMFVAAAVCGLWLILSTIRHDLPQRREE